MSITDDHTQLQGLADTVARLENAFRMMTYRVYPNADDAEYVLTGGKRIGPEDSQTCKESLPVEPEPEEFKFEPLPEKSREFTSPMSEKYPEAYARHGSYEMVRDEKAVRINAIMRKLGMLGVE